MMTYAWERWARENVDPKALYQVVVPTRARSRFEPRNCAGCGEGFDPASANQIWCEAACRLKHRQRTRNKKMSGRVVQSVETRRLADELDSG
jgi:hypothetical protein